MDLIREHLIYKNVPLTIEIDTLKSQEVIRLLLACRKEDVCIMVKESTNKYILDLIHTLKISTRDVSGAVAGAS